MPLYGIDISHHQAGIDLARVAREGFDFVLARVGQGKGGPYGTTRDREWIRHRNEARRHGLLLCAYWYIGDGISAAENARLCADWMGDTSIPVALDCERGSGNVTHYRAVLREFGRRGLHVPLSYIPPWYWRELGRPSLKGLPPMWPSRWVSGSGYASQLYRGVDGSHWASYGGNTCEVLQFSNSARVAGMSVDANAYRGDRDELAALLNEEDHNMPTAKEIAKAVWEYNIPSGNPKNPEWWAATFIKNIELDGDTTNRHLTALRAELASHDDPDRLKRLIREAVEGVDFGDLAADEVADAVISHLGDALSGAGNEAGEEEPS